MSYTPKPITDHPGFFKIPGYSRHGANRKGEILTLKTGNATPGGNAGRYLKVSVYKDGQSEPELEYVHVLVCKAFHGPRPKDRNALHKDDDRSNNRPSNLYWGTQSENVQKAYDRGLKGGTESDQRRLLVW